MSNTGIWGEGSLFHNLNVYLLHINFLTEFGRELCLPEQLLINRRSHIAGMTSDEVSWCVVLFVRGDLLMMRRGKVEETPQPKNAAENREG